MMDIRDTGELNITKTYQRIRPKRALMIASVASMLDLFNSENIDILLKLGYEVDAAANFELGSITSQERVEEYKQELKSKGVCVHNIPIPRDIFKIRQMLHSYKKIKKLADKNEYDIVHCHSPIGGVLCRLACRDARRRGTKVIYTAHGFHFFKGAGRIAWALYYPAERFCANFTDILITINREDYKASKKFHAGRTVYLPGIGIHVDEIKNLSVDRNQKREELGLAPSDFVFMSTGQISVRKNHEVVIRALSRIKNPNVKYLIVGFGELEETLKHLAWNLGLKDRVIFAGYRKDVKELLHAADAFVFPSLQEGLPVALMEAAAAGIPIVASRIRGNVDLIKDGAGGYLADCHDAAGFAEAMKRVMVTDIDSMVQYNSVEIKKYDSHYVNNIMKKIYESVR